MNAWTNENAGEAQSQDIRVFAGGGGDWRLRVFKVEDWCVRGVWGGERELAVESGQSEMFC